jgi:hypothetical protein
MSLEHSWPYAYFCARPGMLIQGNGGGLWFRGTASEHSVIYQYTLVKARNVYMSMIRTESPCKYIA